MLVHLDHDVDHNVGGDDEDGHNDDGGDEDGHNGDEDGHNDDGDDEDGHNDDEDGHRPREIVPARDVPPVPLLGQLVVLHRL